MTQLQTDLVALLRAMRAAERDLFDELSPTLRDAPAPDGGWSPREVLSHLAAWRSIEARRLEATAGGEADDPGDPPRNAEIDGANAALQAQRAGWSWQDVVGEADVSVEALLTAIGASTSEALCDCDATVASIGVNGVNHAIGHLGEVAALGGRQARFDALLREVEAILGRGHLIPRDHGLLLYNIACYRAMSGSSDEARRLLRLAFRRRADLAQIAETDPDLASLREELSNLAASG